MKKTLTLFTLLLYVCTLAAQVQPKPVQIQTIDSSQFVVEYIPLDVAQKNVAAQLVQTDKQIATVEKQIADLVKKRDDLMAQKAALEYLQRQLNQADKTPPPPVQQSAPQAADPPKEKKTPKKKKN